MREIGISPRFSRDKFVPLQTKQRYSTRDISGKVFLTLFFRGFVPFLSLADFVSRDKNLQVADLQRLKLYFGGLVTATTSNLQYGTGCLSDGILGMWMASVCGLDEVLDNEKVRSHLVAVHKYNLKHDLIDHFNPQRPVYACGKDGGLLLCTWPKGGMLSLPFVYSNEVWTGIEYQVASHLMMKGEVEKGLDIVRECRERYDGRVRNPFNEIECGHWYARAMASYGMLQGLTGVRYDAVDKTMYINSKIGDFKSFISTDTGFGTIEWKAGKPVLNVVYGNIDVKRYNVSGKIVD